MLMLMNMLVQMEVLIQMCVCALIQEEYLRWEALLLQRTLDKVSGTGEQYADMPLSRH